MNFEVLFQPPHTRPFLRLHEKEKIISTYKAWLENSENPRAVLPKNVLERVLRAHRLFIEVPGHVCAARADLSGFCLARRRLYSASQVRPIVLQLATLALADLSGGLLSRADFRGADLRRATLACATISNASFAGADLRGADLRQVAARATDFTGADLRGADLTGADVGWANFSGAKLHMADLTRANTIHADFAGAERLSLTGATTEPELAPLVTYAPRPEAAKAVARLKTRIAAHQLWLADPSQPGAKRAFFPGASLACVDLSNQDLRGAVFVKANLKSAILAGANLSNADLRGADLSYADFRGAQMTGTLTRGADLTGAKFE